MGQDAVNWLALGWTGFVLIFMWLAIRHGKKNPGDTDETVQKDLNDGSN